MAKFLFGLICFQVLLVVQINGAIDEVEAKNNKSEIVFRGYDGNKIKVPNRHRESKPSLKLSLHGTSIDKIEAKNATSWTIHLHDKSSGEFAVLERSANVTEYNFLWHGGGPNTEREVCFSYGFNDASWFNAYQSMNASWPMNIKKVTEKQPFNFLFNLDTNSGLPNQNFNEHLYILEQLFYNSDRFALMLDHHSPLFIRRNPNGDEPVMCFSVNNTTPYMLANTEPTYLDLKFRLFAGENIRKISDHVVHQSGYIPVPTEMPNESMFSEIIWFATGMSVSAKETVLTAANEITNVGISTINKIILYGWQTKELDAIVKTETFPEESLISNLRSRKIEIGMELRQITLDNHELTKKYSIGNSNYVDFSIPDACQLLLTKLKNVRFEKQIGIYHLSASNVLVNFILNDTFVQKYPSILTTKYLETANQVGITIVSEYAFRTQHLPVWVRLSNQFEHPYELFLLELIPNALSVSMAGYSFILPYSAGGFRNGDKPNEELLIRWIQAIALMPGFSITKQIWTYSQLAVGQVKKYANLHVEHAPTMVELAKKRIQDGSPIVRPLWYVAPDDAKTYSISDQYMLGEDILVAPVVVIGQTERTIYLISGTWIDQHGKSYQGPGEFKVAAPLEELPYFKRKH